MTATKTELYEQLQDRLRHGMQYAEAGRDALATALVLMETREEVSDDGESPDQA